MTLLNGLLAFGALAFTIPLAIHLLFRSRFKTVDCEAYLKRLRDHEESLRAACRTNKVDLIRLTTDRPFAEALHEYLALRRSLR